MTTEVTDIGELAESLVEKESRLHIFRLEESAVRITGLGVYNGMSDDPKANLALELLGRGEEVGDNLSTRAPYLFTPQSVQYDGPVPILIGEAVHFNYYRPNLEDRRIIPPNARKYASPDEMRVSDEAKKEAGIKVSKLEVEDWLKPRGEPIQVSIKLTNVNPSALREYVGH